MHRRDIGQRRSQRFQHICAAGSDRKPCLIGGEHQLLVQLVGKLRFRIDETVPQLAYRAEGGDGDGIADRIGFFRGDRLHGAAQRFDIV